jgi:hypothetical protein
MGPSLTFQEFLPSGCRVTSCISWIPFPKANKEKATYASLEENVCIKSQKTTEVQEETPTRPHHWIDRLGKGSESSFSTVTINQCQILSLPSHPLLK